MHPHNKWIMMHTLHAFCVSLPVIIVLDTLRWGEIEHYSSIWHLSEINSLVRIQRAGLP